MQRLIETEVAQGLTAKYGRAAVVDALRETLDAARAEIGGGARVATQESLLASLGASLANRRRPHLRRVINATGIVLHTNLGRAPLAPEAVAAVSEIAAGYCNLELDLASGRRGSRLAGVEPLMCDLTGAEAAIVVNNGAAALLLALSALGAGGDAIVSRGELVEIGGGFRLADIVRQGGAQLVEVGAVNKTRLGDYRDAIGPATRLVLKVHQSNFRMVGFTEETGVAELATLTRARGLLLVADLGSGLIEKTRGSAEPTLLEALAAGADLVTCSGDKLLGGPQAGLAAGRRDVIERMRAHPLMRALRLDKMSLAALEATLMLHRDAPERVPVRRMLGQSAEVLAARAERLRAMVGCGDVVSTEAFAGGGALPEEKIASCALAVLPLLGAGEAAARLRAGDPAVVARVKDGRLLIDMLAVPDAELPDLAAALKAALA